MEFEISHPGGREIHGENLGRVTGLRPRSQLNPKANSFSIAIPKVGTPSSARPMKDAEIQCPKVKDVGVEIEPHDRVVGAIEDHRREQPIVVIQ